MQKTTIGEVGYAVYARHPALGFVGFVKNVLKTFVLIAGQIRLQYTFLSISIVRLECTKCSSQHTMEDLTRTAGVVIFAEDMVEGKDGFVSTVIVIIASNAEVNPALSLLFTKQCIAFLSFCDKHSCRLVDLQFYLSQYYYYYVYKYYNL